jgi:hypothetical protein
MKDKNRKAMFAKQKIEKMYAHGGIASSVAVRKQIKIMLSDDKGHVPTIRGIGAGQFNKLYFSELKKRGY